MHIDADAERAALEPFTVTLSGRAYVARPISHPAWRTFQLAVEAATAGTLPEAAQEAALITVLRAAFPYRLPFRWQGDPVRLIHQLPPPVRERVLSDFFVCQATGRAPRSPGPSPTRPASDSSADASASTPAPDSTSEAVSSPPG